MPQPSRNTISFRATCLRALLYILFVTALMQGVDYEARDLSETHFTEIGFTEFTQTLLLALGVALLLYVRQVLKALPSVTLLMLAFLLASLIREQDAHLDTHVFDGAWQVLVTLVVLPSLLLVIRRRREFLAEFEHYADSFSFGLFASGFLVTYVFSRLFGRSELWIAILAENYARTFKDIVEEVTELLGYSLILIAIIELVMLVRRWQARP
ncbi:hypothetical protein [Litchfieldella rifensis]|uniref:Uncharacterized protein n=1 Tax=Litchfieldella rifensis TaxID=762643 RepID=A0ABV7LQL5_9GAMM